MLTTVTTVIQLAALALTLFALGLVSFQKKRDN